MKGFNVKKLAAIATGAALLGTAALPLVSATSITKDDIYSSNGSPNVNIVVGSEAQVSDAIWAGNLAAKIAEKAATTQTVAVSGDAGAGSAELDVSDLTIDVTVGGTVTFGAGSKRYNVNLNSGSAGGDTEVLTAMDSSDANSLTDAQLPHLVDEIVNEKVNNGDQSNQNTSLTVKELIGVDADARFRTGSEYKDLVATIDSGDFSYKVTIGSSTTGVDLGSTSFTDGSDDNIKLFFFGEEYELNTATLTGTKNIKLVKSSAKESYNEGETIEGLVGDNLFEGEDVSIKVVQITQSGPAAGSYSVTFELYDAEGNLIDTQTVAAGSNLRTSFKDSDGDEALQSNLFVDTVAVGSTTGVGYVEVTKGTDTIELYDGKKYPYDSTDTSGTKPYTVYLTTGSGDANSLYSIEVRNSAEIWVSPSGGSFDLGPIYPTKTDQSLTGKSSSQAEFLQGLPDGTLGKGYAKVEFSGFENKEERTVINFGKNNTTVHNLDSTGTNILSTTNGGISFRADNDVIRSVPFYMKLNDTNSGATFSFEGKDIVYSLRYATGTGGKDTTFDYNLTINTGDYVNGRLWTISDPTPVEDVNVLLTVGGIGVIGTAGSGVTTTRSAGWATTDANLHIGDTFAIDGVTYKITDNNITAGTRMGVVVDTVVKFIANTTDIASTNTPLYNTSGDTTDDTYGLLALTNDSTFDGNAFDGAAGSNPVTIPVQNSTDTTRPIYYAAKYATGAHKLYLLLDADKFGVGASNKIQNSHEVWFLGTNVPADDGTYTEAGDMNAGFANGEGAVNATAGVLTGGQIIKNGTTWQYAHFVPKESDYNSTSSTTAAGVYTSSNAYFVAESIVNDAVSNGDFNVYIDTSDGGIIGPFGGTTNLAGYAYDARFRGSPNWNLISGTQSDYLKAGYTDAGTKAWLLDSDAGVRVSAPQTAEKIDLIVYGTEVSRSVEGGEKLTLKVSESGTTSGGTKVTLEAVNGGSCSGSAAAGTCVANPSTYMAQASVGNPIVYVDTDAPAGTNIVIGGHIVNSLAQGLSDRLTSPSSPIIAETDAATGNIYLAGYTAEQTGQAVKELIDDIDGWA